jgi:hypothetical protein
MSTKLYVSNLSQSATVASVRELFGACGDVIEVQFAAERASRDAHSAAYVTMATSKAADKALKDLHGKLHRDRVLVINSFSGDTGGSSDSGSRSSRKAAPDEAKVLMTQQYRDRNGMTYELSCSGKLLTLRFVFPLDDTHDWQVEARLVPGPTSAVIVTAMTREKALLALVEASTATGSDLADSGLDWEGVTKALRAVRAI